MGTIGITLTPNFMNPPGHQWHKIDTKFHENPPCYFQLLQSTDGHQCASMGDDVIKAENGKNMQEWEWR